jgi:hypothetical protein
MKMLTTIVASFAIMLALFGIFVLFYNANRDSVEYIIDTTNRCTWESGVITDSTEVTPFISIKKVAKADEESYLETSEMAGTCTARRGDDSGSYATKLNRYFNENGVGR